MNRIKYHSLHIVFLALLIGGCNGLNGNNHPTRLARVGDKYLTVGDAYKAIPEFMLQEDSIGAIRHYTTKWVQRKVILQEAERLQLRQQKSVQALLERAEQEILLKALKDIVIGEFNKDLVVTDEEARNYYQAHKDQLILHERFVRFRHIETRTIEAARAAKRELMAGIPWPEVASKYSLSPEVKINKSKEYWPISMAVADLDIMNRYLHIIGRTEISPIQRINRSYHFVQLMESKPKGGHPDLDWLIEQIKSWLLIEKRRRHYSSYVKNLYLKAKMNNEIDFYNVLTPSRDPQKSVSDTLESTKTNE